MRRESIKGLLAASLFFLVYSTIKLLMLQSVVFVYKCDRRKSICPSNQSCTLLKYQTAILDVRIYRYMNMVSWKECSKIIWIPYRQMYIYYGLMSTENKMKNKKFNRIKWIDSQTKRNHTNAFNKLLERKTTLDRTQVVCCSSKLTFYISAVVSIFVLTARAKHENHRSECGYISIYVLWI